MAVLPQLVPASAGVDSAGALPRKVLLWLWVAFWLFMITVQIGDALGNPRISWWEPVLWEGSSALVITGWLLMAIRARERYAKYLARPLVWLGCYSRWLPMVAVTFITVVYAIRHGVYALVGRTYEHPPWPFVFIYESVKLTMFAGLWLGILFGLDSYTQWQLQRRRLLQMQRALTEAQLARLQGQLRPHFFFNALNTISALMHVDVARADRLVAGLGDLLHISLRSGEHEMTSLAEELRALGLYGHIMQERFRDRITLNWQTDQMPADIQVPALLLQPLLENAFKHGVERTTTHVRINVSVRREDGILDIVVSNTGSGLAPEHREGVGLRNCRERLKLIYGDAASLRLHDENGAVAAQVLIPLTDASQ